MASSKPIKVSVLGMGMSATVFHIPFIQTLPHLFSLHSIFERSATTEHSEARKRYGNGIKVVTSLEEVVNDSEVDCVVISTPNITHYPYAKASLQAGKNVIIEKPLVPTSTEAEELITLAASHSPPLIIATYQNRRYDSDFLTVKKLMDKGVFGDIVEFETRFDRYRPVLKGGGTWKEQSGAGQGIVYDLGSHLVDQVLTLFGTPDRIYAHIYNARKLGPADFDDAFFAEFYYDSGANGSQLPLVVTVRGSPLSALKSQPRYTIKGTKGSFLKHGLDVQEDQLRVLNPPMATSDSAFGVEPESNYGLLTTVDSSNHMKEERVVAERGNYLGWYEDVGAALQAHDPSKLYVTPEQARETIRMIELMYESSRSEKVVHTKTK
ncbi:hypothetical protein FRB94_008504 [Tulasnella sp. JGI-2019a]|nr:hypothetical protein FRB93_010826 [Tulasnella sp. JGI-2019a]KAG9011433.1 hypothetical protein FRB94_008504 [Tulasnella sp. JGI-2019a]